MVKKTRPKSKWPISIAFVRLFTSNLDLLISRSIVRMMPHFGPGSLGRPYGIRVATLASARLGPVCIDES